MRTLVTTDGLGDLEKRGERGKVWGAGDRQGLGEGLVGRENGQRVASGWSL